VLQLRERDFGDMCILDTDLLPCLDHHVSDITSFPVHAQACQCIQRLVARSSTARAHFLASEGHTIAAINATISKLAALPASTDVHEASLGLSGILLQMCSCVQAMNALDDLVHVIQRLFHISQLVTVICQCCQSMQRLCQLPASREQSWSEHTCLRLLELQLAPQYNLAVWATVAAVALSRTDPDAGMYMVEHGAPAMLQPTLHVATDSVLLKHRLELLAVLSSTGASFKPVMAMHASGCMRSALRVLQKDTWRRHVQPILVILQLFTEFHSIQLPRLEWTPELIDTLIKVHPTDDKDLDMLLYKVMNSIAVALARHPPSVFSVQGLHTPFGVSAALHRAQAWLQARAWQWDGESGAPSARESAQGSPEGPPRSEPGTRRCPRIMAQRAVHEQTVGQSAMPPGSLPGERSESPASKQKRRLSMRPSLAQIRPAGSSPAQRNLQNVDSGCTDVSWRIAAPDNSSFQSQAFDVPQNVSPSPVVRQHEGAQRSTGSQTPGGRSGSSCGTGSGSVTRSIALQRSHQGGAQRAPLFQSSSSAPRLRSQLCAISFPARLQPIVRVQMQVQSMLEATTGQGCAVSLTPRVRVDLIVQGEV
jgi:hypothetical protein